MESVLKITQQEFEKIIAEEISEMSESALHDFREALEKNGLVLTSDLKNSFTRAIITNSVAMVARAEIAFNAYGRIKDIKRYTYNGYIPPVQAMEEFVRKEGLNEFAWIFYYRHLDGRKSAFQSEERLINRIAWIIAMNKRRFPNVKRNHDSWYNENKMKYINEVRKRLRWRIASAVHAAQRGVFDDMAESRSV